MLQDFDTWSSLRKHYLATEYHVLYTAIQKHCDKYHALPTFEELKYEIRDSATKEKLLAIESIEVDVDAYMLLEYLKNQFVQGEILDSLEDYIDKSVSFEDAEESIAHLHQIIIDVEAKVDLEDPSESMQRIDLFEDDEDLARYVSLGLNADYDAEVQFSPTDFILIGGKRGAGKSLTCSNIANTVYNRGKTALYFTIEMPSKQILQRCCAAAVGVPFARLRKRNLNITEWEKVVNWWGARFKNSQSIIDEYMEHRDFKKFHHKLTTTCALDPSRQIDVIYDPRLTLARIEAEVNKKVKTHDVGVIIVDYINQVKRGGTPSRNGQYDWTEQIEIAKALKDIAADYKIPVISPYQIDSSGEARFSKGILDSADAAFTLNAHSKADNCITFECVKMRNDNDDVSFTSEMDWSCLKIGPASAEVPSKEKSDSSDKPKKTGENIEDLPF